VEIDVRALVLRRGTLSLCHTNSHLLRPSQQPIIASAAGDQRGIRGPICSKISNATQHPDQHLLYCRLSIFIQKELPPIFHHGANVSRSVVLGFHPIHQGY
jgi:hypothetical protein